jgi:hypothetical protein
MRALITLPMINTSSTIFQPRFVSISDSLAMSHHACVVERCRVSTVFAQRQLLKESVELLSGVLHDH